MRPLNCISNLVKISADCAAYRLLYVRTLVRLFTAKLRTYSYVSREIYKALDKAIRIYILNYLCIEGLCVATCMHACTHYSCKYTCDLIVYLEEDLFLHGPA